MRWHKMLILASSVVVLSGCAGPAGSRSTSVIARNIAQPGATIRMDDNVWTATAPGQSQIPGATFATDAMRTDQVGQTIDTLTVGLAGIGVGNTKSNVAFDEISVTDGERTTIIRGYRSNADTQNQMITAMKAEVLAAQVHLSADEIQRLTAVKTIVDSVGGVFKDVVGAGIEALLTPPIPLLKPAAPAGPTAPVTPTPETTP